MSSPPGRHHDSQAMLAPAPCDSCWHARRCQAEHLACRAFSMFMAGESPVRWATVNRTPTRERYDALLGAS